MTASLALYVGNRNYSSWSLRGHLPLAVAGLDFDERVVVLDTDDTASELARVSPSGRVPVLVTSDGPVWDSLAIAEFAAESAPALWPASRPVRALARSVASEMHAGFAALRRDMPMNIRGRFPGVGHSTAALRDVAVVLKRWTQLLSAHGGVFLFGDTFTIADAMFAPVVTRFVTYAVEVPAAAQAYMDAVLATEPMVAWSEKAAAESWQCSIAEPGSPDWQGGPLAG